MAPTKYVYVCDLGLGNSCDNRDTVIVLCFPMVIVTSVIFDIVIIGIIVALSIYHLFSNSSVSIMCGLVYPNFKRFVVFTHIFRVPVPYDYCDNCEFC